MATEQEPFYEIVVLFDHLESAQCPQSPMHTSITNDYFTGRTTVEAALFAREYYDNAAIPHFRCQSGSNDIACRPEMDANAICVPNEELWLNTTPKKMFTSLDECLSQRYVSFFR